MKIDIYYIYIYKFSHTLTGHFYYIISYIMENLLVAIIQLLPSELVQKILNNVPWKQIALHISYIRDDQLRMYITSYVTSLKCVKQKMIDFNVGCCVRIYRLRNWCKQDGIEIGHILDYANIFETDSQDYLLMKSLVDSFIITQSNGSKRTIIPAQFVQRYLTIQKLKAGDGTIFDTNELSKVPKIYHDHTISDYAHESTWVSELTQETVNTDYVCKPTIVSIPPIDYKDGLEEYGAYNLIKYYIIKSEKYCKSNLSFLDKYEHTKTTSIYDIKQRKHKKKRVRLLHTKDRINHILTQKHKNPRPNSRHYRRQQSRFDITLA